MKVVGAKELLNLMAELPKRVRSKAMRSALNLASGPIVKSVKSKVPKQTGDLARSIGKRVKASVSKGNASAVVGARKGYRSSNGKRNKPSRYLHLVDKGTDPHGNHPGTSGKHFMEDAYRENKERAERTVEQRYRTVILSEARKLGKL